MLCAYKNIHRFGVPKPGPGRGQPAGFSQNMNDWVVVEIKNQTNTTAMYKFVIC